MQRKYSIGLIKRTYVSGATQSITEDPPRNILAKRKAVRQSEFYQAVASGFRPEITFIIWVAEYEGEDQLLYENKKYEIIRSAPAEDEKEIELICQPVDDANRNLSQLRTGF